MSGLLRANGATLYYEVHGTGPVLLISQSGEGDADRTTDLVRHLAGDHTVITYDRRGLSRSALDDPDRGASMADHVDDVHRLLAAVTDRPAHMLGCSFGAVIGLHLAVEHPEQLDTLIAHEPVAPGLLPAPERVRHIRELEELQDLYRERGLAEAFGEIAAALGIDPVAQDTEPGLTPHPLDDRRRAGFDFFIRNDFGAVVRDTLDVAALGDTPVRVIPAFGRTTPRHVFDYRCAHELAALLGVEAREFPGGHNGNTTHPRAYATRILDLLAA
ncbi:alpha/beta hydrolase [Microbispora triticiradicis]|uniref:Alpha/beta hydrolase n=3 Tax=Microbispora TaxID=2005 RepID=A0ABY3LV90_9ACTN|nr:MULTISPECIES: alpha/beta hydrolase [Microbispora]RGA04737.1 alpha/beta hydrolase [Microbispora triticiradicis]TLP52388.1 alpha/beta hydrolase [Microbispora fusca]TYB55446.1 alpha/beta hydrolase [Microbispora tritici]GLW20630.1 putative hydrolase YraK [Microbispora amethystogenes]